jgi:hypothetical protein
MYLQKVISRKNSFFVDILKINDKNSRIRIQDPPNPDPDLLVRDMDPRVATCKVQGVGDGCREAQ